MEKDCIIGRLREEWSTLARLARGRVGSLTVKGNDAMKLLCRKRRNKRPSLIDIAINVRKAHVPTISGISFLSIRRKST